MDFNKLDIRRFLIDSIPSRFNNLHPSEFVSFLAHMLRTDGYEVDEISKNEEAAGDLVARKEEASMVLNALLYPADRLAGIGEIQKASAARTYHECGQAWIVTTSSFTVEAKKEADKQDIELWDWDAFYLAISQLYFEGKSHYDFVEKIQPPRGVEMDTASMVKIKTRWQPEEGVSSEWYSLEIRITNVSDRHIYLHLDLPALINTGRNQFIADQWSENAFVSGMIYSGASIKTNALFKASRLGERPPGGRVMLTCHERTDPPSTYHLGAKIRGSACYLVTYCFGYGSEEYKLMIRYRDEVLSKHRMGRRAIDFYYLLSPALLKIAPAIPLLDVVIRSLTKLIIRCLKKIYIGP